MNNEFVFAITNSKIIHIVWEGTETFCSYDTAKWESIKLPLTEVEKGKPGWGWNLMWATGKPEKVCDKCLKAARQIVQYSEGKWGHCVKGHQGIIAFMHNATEDELRDLKYEDRQGKKKMVFNEYRLMRFRRERNLVPTVDGLEKVRGLGRGTVDALKTWWEQNVHQVEES